MNFWVKTKYVFKKVFPKYVWDIPNHHHRVFLTFDDGPTPEITEWVLEQLKEYDAHATFFCIGHNVEKHPAIYNRIITEGHSIGNHTFNHLNGWKTSKADYVENVKKCRVKRHLFRPPYGKIKPSQSRALRGLGFMIVMWDIISYDWDVATSEEQCLANVLDNISTGSIVVFHDSVKAERNLKYVLPKTLAFLKEKGFVCAKID